MSNRGAKRTKPKSKDRKITQPRESRSSRGRQAVVAIILGIATLLGYAILIPRMTVTLSDPPDPKNPLSSSVTVTNTGYIPLESVGSGLAIRKLLVMGPNGVTGGAGSEDYNSILTTGEGHYLGMDDGYSFALNNLSVFQSLTPYPMVSADIAIVVDYEIPIIHLRRRKTFIEFAQKQTNGNFYWYKNSPPK